jgi:hypothetical protein
MKESYGKGLATHPGPESCAGGGPVAISPAAVNGGSAAAYAGGQGSPGTPLPPSGSVLSCRDG